jgi:PKD repeat protein
LDGVTGLIRWLKIKLFNMKKLIYNISIILSFTLIFSACEEEDYDFGDITAPSNIQVTPEIVGADANNPFGDGSGVVNFTATADNALAFHFVYNDAAKLSTDGRQSYAFSTTGTHTYTVTVVAFGTGGASSSTTVEVEVLVLYTPPADLVTMLTADSSRTWRIYKDEVGHFGVGPADSFDITPIWWNAGPNDKEGFGAYDDRMIFNVDGTFTYITNGDMYGKADPMAEDLAGSQGLTANGDAEYENYPFGDFTDTWFLSEPGGRETLTFNGLGYHGFYVGGDHSYAILARSENEMTLKTVGKDGNGWWGILIADE